ncbi:hypothetical protein C8Q79DRAFT_1010827 [Trametes meyenii]|nr:hypothetical protein C8Q79DRAFT_1010827 [Trametes meyenii]
MTFEQGLLGLPSFGSTAQPPCPTSYILWHEGQHLDDSPCPPSLKSLCLGLIMPLQSLPLSSPLSTSARSGTSSSASTPSSSPLSTPSKQPMGKQVLPLRPSPLWKGRLKAATTTVSFLSQPTPRFKCIPYPEYVPGIHVPIQDLVAYSKTHAWPDPIKCFCSLKDSVACLVRIFVPRSGANAGDPCLGCSGWVPNGVDGCRYWVNLRAMFTKAGIFEWVPKGTFPERQSRRVQSAPPITETTKNSTTSLIEAPMDGSASQAAIVLEQPLPPSHLFATATCTTSTSTKALSVPPLSAPPANQLAEGPAASADTNTTGNSSSDGKAAGKQREKSIRDYFVNIIPAVKEGFVTDPEHLWAPAPDALDLGRIEDRLLLSEEDVDHVLYELAKHGGRGVEYHCLLVVLGGCQLCDCVMTLDILLAHECIAPLLKTNTNASVGDGPVPTPSVPDAGTESQRKKKCKIVVPPAPPVKHPCPSSFTSTCSRIHAADLGSGVYQLVDAATGKMFYEIVESDENDNDDN